MNRNGKASRSPSYKESLDDEDYTEDFKDSSDESFDN